MRKKQKTAKCPGYVARTKVKCRLSASWFRCWANERKLRILGKIRGDVLLRARPQIDDA